MTSMIIGCGATAGGVNIWTAVEQNDPVAIKAYSDAGGSLDARSWDGSTPLIVAIDLEKRDSFKALLEHGADPDIITSGNRCATHLAALKDGTYWLKTALDLGADPNLEIMIDDRFRSGTPFRYAISNSSLENVRLLVEHGVDIDKTDSVGRHPIAQAAAQNDFEVVLYLLNQGADYKNARRGNRAFIEIIEQKWRDRSDYRKTEIRKQVETVHAWLKEHD
ncbi:Ankyrin repeats (3 copies) [Symmachiella macrocystis]|uniref:Ankyrin repeats (3 copies) n=1 Tax=Symmachiella macrocystis TaxID=2527985 RepID=A0A5C6BDL4_9PLAN|nr:ankyrin repeat domain-containing protein [Symmachiella macrocystis]TWU09366.1 Ankyrin repeats (3 copies) [Symmachiella macrocystis]